MRKPSEEYLSGNLTAMIDVVFQLIIFFVCTTTLQDAVVDQRIRLAMAPHGMPLVVKDPLEININVDAKGGVSIGGQSMTLNNLVAMLDTAVKNQGPGVQIPVVIRGDEKTEHIKIKNVMDSCKKAGLYKVKFAALKERG